MDRNSSNKKLMAPALLAGLALPGLAGAANIDLCAGVTSFTPPGSAAPIPMWGFAEGPASGSSCANPPTVPGLPLNVPVGEGLTVTLNNTLSVPVSLVIAGQPMPDAAADCAGAAPVWTDGSTGARTSLDQRVRSFGCETPPGGTQTYTWASLNPGSHVYHSGTHPQVQVQMGLYGPSAQDAATGEVYTGVPYDTEVELFYSEIDPALHAAVAGGTYGDVGAGGPTSTISYHPKFFLVNGAPYDPAAAASSELPAGSAGQRTLVRFRNMGLRTLAPALLGEHLTLLGEDGHPYPYPRVVNTVMLPAGKTVDALLVADAEGSYPLFDRRNNLTNNGSADPGGLYSYLVVGAPDPNRPTAVADNYSLDEDTVLTVDAPGVLDNDTTVPPGGSLTATLVSVPSQGEVTLNGDGSFVYTPPANFSGVTGFSYMANDGSLNSNVAQVTLTVNGVNDPPVAMADGYNVTAGSTLTVNAPGVLANDSDPDGDTLTATVVSGPANGVLALNGDGSFTYTPNTGFDGADSFVYAVNDGNGGSTQATVDITVDPPVLVEPVAAGDYATTTRHALVTIPVLANDKGTDGNLITDPTGVTVTLTSGATRDAAETLTVNANQEIEFTPRARFLGSTNFTYTVTMDGLTSNEAQVQVDVTRK